jgi:hypothetical protein
MNGKNIEVHFLPLIFPFHLHFLHETVLLWILRLTAYY